MRKRLFPLRLLASFLIIWGVFYAFPVHCQSSIGLYQITVSSKYSGDRPPFAVSRAGLGVGLGAHIEFKIAKDVYFALEPGYLIENGKLQYADTTARLFKRVIEYKDSIDLQKTSVILPAFFRIVSDNQKFHVTGGIEFGLINSFTAASEQNEIDLDNDIKDFNFSANFGFGYRIPIGRRSKLRLDFRYIQGLRNLTDNLGDPETHVPRVKMRSFRLLLGWDISIKRKNKGE